VSIVGLVFVFAGLVVAGLISNHTGSDADDERWRTGLYRVSAALGFALAGVVLVVIGILATWIGALR
jgi:hypothetical protein